MKTYTLKLNSGTTYKLYDGATLVTDIDLGTLFGSAGSAYFVFDFDSGTPSDLTAVSITNNSDNEVMGVTGLAAGTVKENYNFEGSWDGATTTFTSFAQLQGQALDEAQLGFLMGKIKEAQASGITELTANDYNYPTSGTATSVALWLLQPGVYMAAPGVNISISNSFSYGNNGGYYLVEEKTGGTNYGIWNIGPSWMVTYDVVKSSGTSSTYAYVALTSDLFADPGTKYKVQIGASSSASGADSVAVGESAQATAQSAVAVGYLARAVNRAVCVGSAGANGGARAAYSIAIGSVATAGTSATEGIAIGRESSATGQYTISVGSSTKTAGDYSIAIGNLAGKTSSSNARSIQIGYNAQAGAPGAIALGAYSVASTAGEMNIGTGELASGYNSSSYRLLSGVYDPQSAHDAATKGYCDNAILNGGTSAPTTATVGAVGTQYTYVDTTGTPTAHLCVCTEIDTTDPSTPVYTWQQLV